ncbi:proline/glycine betaine ABC transporter permease [Acidimicrobiia bacterium EGI L10123]|uniref:ABC transporter permease n=1 Tax=Salinilacustrithrix flava TaxID=2957203 RepID=UPI003D7C3610|nr:proline/glycine betaine ABC transporter permease [Acidimicrobiia bacterium EGI L10123]
MVEIPRIPIGERVDEGVDWLTDNLGGFFDLVADQVRWLVDHLEDLLLWPPAIVLAALMGLLAWRLRSVTFGAFTFVSMLFIESMTLWEESMSTLSLVVIATLVAVAVGIPLGIAAASNERVSSLLRPVLDFMQTMPAFVYLIPAITFFGIGAVPGVVATVVFAMPPAARLTELGIRQVDTEVVEAAESFGAPPRQVLRKVQLPLALPTIMAGVNQVIMLALSMVVIAGIVGAGGLGAEVFRGITRLDVGVGFEGGLAVVILAVFLDRTTASIGSSGRRTPPAGTA